MFAHTAGYGKLHDKSVSAARALAKCSEKLDTLVNDYQRTGQIGREALSPRIEKVMIQFATARKRMGKVMAEVREVSETARINQLFYADNGK